MRLSRDVLMADAGASGFRAEIQRSVSYCLASCRVWQMTPFLALDWH